VSGCGVGFRGFGGFEVQTKEMMEIGVRFCLSIAKDRDGLARFPGPCTPVPSVFSIFVRTLDYYFFSSFSLLFEVLNLIFSSRGRRNLCVASK